MICVAYADAARRELPARITTISTTMNTSMIMTIITSTIITMVIAMATLMGIITLMGINPIASKAPPGP
ncbi:hypothetical protein D3C79_855630 [compost metagenome]